LISWTPPCLSLASGSFLVSFLCPRKRASSNPCPFLVGCGSASIRGQELLDRTVKPGDDSSENREQAGWGGAVPGAGGMARDTGTCSSARIEARNCSIRTLPVAPPALSTPAGGTRRPSAPPGTSLRNATHLNSRSCFVLTRVEARVKATSAPAIASCRRDVFDAPAKPLNPPYSAPKKASFRGVKPCCCGAHKGIDHI
jgi:hypothetical protein